MSRLYKSILLTCFFLSCNMLLLVLISCSDGSPFDEFGCPLPHKANVTEIKRIFYSPYVDLRYSLETDTVSLAEFRYNFELEMETISSAQISFPGQLHALSCIPLFDIQNISHIQVILESPFNGLPIGTDISYLLLLPDETQLSKLRDFKNASSYFSMKLSMDLTDLSQLHTELIVLLRNGQTIRKSSISPVLVS